MYKCLIGSWTRLTIRYREGSLRRPGWHVAGSRTRANSERGLNQSSKTRALHFIFTHYRVLLMRIMRPASAQLHGYP
jgi:hypothetical protein